MKFITNKLGVVIVLIALIASLFIGVITNTTTSTTTVTDYSYVADMSQTFNYSNEPAYIEYDPTSNYTGYALSNGLSAGVAYTEASSPSNYKMTTDRSTNTTSLDLNTVTPNPTYTVLSSACVYNAFEEVFINPPSPLPFTDTYLWAKDPNVVTLRQLISTFTASAPAGTNTITMRFMDGVNETESGYGLDINRVVYVNTDNFLYTALGPWRYIDPQDRSPMVDNATYQTGSYEYIQNDAQPTVLNTSYPIVYDIQRDSAYINKNGAYQSINVESIYVIWASSNVYKSERITTTMEGHGDPVFTEIDADWTTNVYCTYDSYQQSYIKINDGVRINNTNTALTTIWSNDNDNGLIDIVFGKNNDLGMSNTFTLDYEGDNDAQLTISRYDNGNVTISYNGNDYNLGTWNYFLLRFNAMEGTLAAYPVTSFTNYTQFTPSNNPLNFGSSQYVTIPTGVIQSITWDAVSEVISSFTFSVSDTVIRDTFQLLMINPSIDIGNYFAEADAEGWRLNFYSFGTVGTSMTINGVTYPISDGRITINNKSYKLTNIYVSYDILTDHISITFVNDRITLDLGERTTSVISMQGSWFFNTGYYDADIVQRTDTKIQWSRLPPMGTVSLIFIGITLLLMAVAIKKFGFTMTDYIVTITSVAVAFCLMEVFI